MGKASSSKKVARAAGIGGGRSHRRQTPWAYFGVIGLIVALGLAGTVFSRNQRNDHIASAGTNGVFPVGSTNYEAYAVYICGKFVDPIKTPASNPHGITAWVPASGAKAAKDGGVIEIKPKTKDVAGKNATLGKFTDAVGIKLNAAEIQMPGGKLYLGGDTCNGKAADVFVKQFDGPQDPVGKLFNGAKAKPAANGKPATPAQLAKLNPPDIPFVAGDALTIAFVAPSDATSIPPPSTDVDTELAAALSAAAATTTTTSVP